MEETIVAISTVIGEGAINIIRLSGKESINIVNKIFNGKDLTLVKSNTINYGKIIYNKEIIDEVLVSVFLAPKTFTRENIVEINCHGSIASTNKILEIILELGVRLAEPGEFLKRAFLNGRIDLIEAESVSDLIKAKTENARKLSMNGINKNISNIIKSLREEILSVIANIEVNIDYPEYEDAVLVTNQLLKDKVLLLENQFEELLNKSENYRIVKHGINIGIIGRPNVGKSSILNKLLGEEKAIVTEIEGTTRDIIEGSITLKGYKLNFIDTAGIRETTNKVEKIGVTKSLDTIQKSDLVLLVLDGSSKLLEEDKKLLNTIKEKNALVIINKIDLTQKLDISYLKDFEFISITTTNDSSIKILLEKLEQLLNIGKIEETDFTYLTNARQVNLLKESTLILKEIKNSIKQNIPVDLIEIDLRKLWDKLGEITGETYKDELLDEIFSKFCLGK